jgi:hypothetical protein
MKLLVHTLLVAMVTTASAESIMDAFKKFRDEKANQHQLPDSVKGVVCERSGTRPKSLCCYNKHGVRCSPDFQSERKTCPGAGCRSERVRSCPRRSQPGERCGCIRGKNTLYCTRTHSCKNNGDIQQSMCPQPCGCVLDGQPKRESAGMMKTHKIQGECGSQHVLNEMKTLLGSWKVPHDAMNKFEMAAMFDSAQFTVFDLFVQPKKNEARYKLSIGAARCHANHVEIGYMDTGMWKVDTVNDYKCGYKKGCSEVGIKPDSIEKARKALEWYAWKNLRIGRRRLSEVGDSIEDIGVHTVEMDQEKSPSPSMRGSWSDFDERTLAERVVENDMRRELGRGWDEGDDIGNNLINANK